MSLSRIVNSRKWSMIWHKLIGMAKRHLNEIPSPLSQDDSDNDENSTVTTQSKTIRLAKKSNLPPVITCNFLPHCSNRPFTSFAHFESHYAQVHSNRCMECYKNFPSERYLSIHITENHDVFAQLKMERGEKIYACFVDNCDRFCSTPQKRRLHLIDKHGFPKEFFFRVVDYGIDNCMTLLKKPKGHGNSHSHASEMITRSTEALPSKLEGDNESVDAMSISEDLTANGDVLLEVDTRPLPEDSSKREKQKESAENRAKTMTKVLGSAVDSTQVASLTDMMAAVKLVPTSVKFGRRSGSKVGFGRK